MGWTYLRLLNRTGQLSLLSLMERLVGRYDHCIHFFIVFINQGYLFEYSVLFYGYYDSGLSEPHYAPPYNPHPQLGWGYKLPLSYLLTVSGVFVMSIIATIIRCYTYSTCSLRKLQKNNKFFLAWQRTTKSINVLRFLSNICLLGRYLQVGTTPSATRKWSRPRLDRLQ